MNATRLNLFRQCQYNAAVERLTDEAGHAWRLLADVQKDARLRALGVADLDAFNRKAARLRVRLNEVRKFAADAGLPSAAHAARQLRELAALVIEVKAFHVPPVDVVVLDSDWGKKGRAARIVAWIVANNPTAADVAKKYQLALSTGKSYLRRARPLAERRAA